MTTRLCKHRPDSATDLGRRFLRPGDSVIDVGAADGEYTAIWAEMVGPTGSVVAIEPHPMNAAWLREANAERPWVRCVEAAVGADAGFVPFYPDQCRPRCGSLWRENVQEGGLSYPVQRMTLTELVMPGVPRLIKLDVQGAEADVIRGANQWLHLPIVWVIELWQMGLRHAGATVADVLEPFRELAYRACDVWGQPIRWEDAERDAERRPMYSSVDVVVVPEGLC